MRNPIRLAESHNKHRLESIDFLRGLAILAVLAEHVPHYAHGGWRLHPWFFPAFLMDFGHYGVQLFVLISGFCIHLGAARKKSLSGKWSVNWIGFWKRRIWRLFPPYVISIVLSLLIAGTLHERYDLGTMLTFGDVAKHFFLVQNLFHTNGLGLGNGVYWSLGMEEQLYLLYFPILIGLSRYSYKSAVLVPISVCVIWRACLPFISSHGSLFGLFPFTFWAFWVFGAISVDQHLGNIKLPRWCASSKWAGGFLFAGILFNAQTLNLRSNRLFELFNIHQPVRSVVAAEIHLLSELILGLGFFCFINVLVEREGRSRWPRLLVPLSALGRISYSIYLTHFPVMHVLGHHFPISLTSIGWPLCVVLYGIISVACGTAFYYFVERHVLSTPPSLSTPSGAV